MNRFVAFSLIALLATPAVVQAAPDAPAPAPAPAAKAAAQPAAQHPDSAQYPADSSGKNVRDRDGSTLTPADQAKGSDADVKITQAIRKAVVDDDSLSMNAHNVKIITLDGMVTLRGPVESQAEKTKVASIAAERAGGPAKVTNQIEVAP